MAYRLVENKGDSVAVPQLVIAKLPELEDDWLRVALFVVATGETDPARIAAALRLKSRSGRRRRLFTGKAPAFWRAAANRRPAVALTPRPRLAHT